MPACVQVLNLAIIRPFVADEKSRSNWTAIGISSVILEDLIVQVAIQVVDRIVERQHHQLRPV